MASRGGRSGGANRSMPSMGNLLNLERVPPLAPKFANKIGKTAAGYAVFYDGGGTSVKVQSMLDKNGEMIHPPPADGKYAPVDLVEFERRVALYNAPSPDERLSALRRKYELRLEKEFPAKGPSSGSESDIQAWMASLPFNERVALLKSQKDFEKSKVPSKGT